MGQLTARGLLSWHSELFMTYLEFFKFELWRRGSGRGQLEAVRAACAPNPVKLTFDSVEELEKIAQSFPEVHSFTRNIISRCINLNLSS